MPAVASTSGRLHSEFCAFFEKSGKIFSTERFFAIYLIYPYICYGPLSQKEPYYYFFHPEELVTLWCAYMSREKKNGPHDNGDDKSV
jgi:hypothetical protein